MFYLGLSLYFMEKKTGNFLLIFLYYLQFIFLKHNKNSYQNSETFFPPLECFKLEVKILRRYFQLLLSNVCSKNKSAKN